MPSSRRTKKAAVSKIPPNTMRTATELDMLAAVATSVHLENEQAENSAKPKRSTRSKKIREDDLAVEQIICDEPEPLPVPTPSTIGPKPKTMEMTQNLMDSLMFPIKVRPSVETDEIFVTIPLDQTDEPDYFKATFTGGIKLKISGYDEEYPIKNMDGYIQCFDESAPNEGSVRRERKKVPKSLHCNENFNEIDSELRMQSWLDQVEHGQWTVLLREHDYFQQFVKFGRPESTTYIDAAIAAYNKYKNFVSLSCPTLDSPNYLFGLWWEKEEPAVDFWLLPKPIDQPDNVYQGLPENHWSGNVVVAREELIDVNTDEGKSVPFFDLLDTPVDTRRFDQQISWEETKKSFQMQNYDDEHAKASRSIQPYKSEASSMPSTSLKPIRKAIGRPPAGQYRTVHVQRSTETVGSYETVEHEDEDSPDDADVHQSNPLRMQVPNGTGDGRNRKLLSREKVEEMDFAMRCIKEIQHHRYRGYYPLRCKICQREFTAPTSLIVHYRSHAGIKPFTCSVCLASFTRRHSLKYHMLCHSGQARFRCEICQRLFRHSGHFRDHMRKHELGTPFACSMCDSEFGTRTSFRRHMLLTHEQTPNLNQQSKKVQQYNQPSTSRNQVIDESFAAVHNLMKRPNRARRNVYEDTNDVLVEELVDHEMDIETSANSVPGLLVIPSSSGSSQTLVVQKSGEVRVANSNSWTIVNSKNISPPKVPIARVKQEKSPIVVGQASNDPSSSSYSFNKMMVSSSSKRS